MQAGDPRFKAAVADLNRFLDQGGKLGVETPPFVVQVKKPIEKIAPAKEIVVGSQASDARR